MAPEAEELKRQRNRVAQKRYKERQKQKMSDMEAELKSKRDELAALLRLNLTLRARERVLERALDGGEQQMSVLVAQSAHCDAAAAADPQQPAVHAPRAASPDGRAAVCPGLSSGGLSDAWGTSSRADGSGLTAPSATGSPAEDALHSGTPVGAALPQAAPDLTASPPSSSAPEPEAWHGDAALEGVLHQLRGGLPLEQQEVPEDLLRAIGAHFKASVNAYQAADMLPEGPEADEMRNQGLQTWTYVHGFMRHACLARPLLRYQLRHTNLETFERCGPPPGHWDAVLDGVDAFSELSEDSLAEICEVWGLFSQAMGKIRQQQDGILRELQQLSTSTDMTPPIAAGSASLAGVEGAEERQLRYDQLLSALEASAGQEQALSNVLSWNTSSLVPPKLLARATARGYPFWFDTWAAMEVVARRVAGSSAQDTNARQH